jgi:hypothetical protein
MNAEIIAEVAHGIQFGAMPFTGNTEAVSSHPGENGRWEPKKASKQPCAGE